MKCHSKRLLSIKISTHFIRAVVTNAILQEAGSELIWEHFTLLPCAVFLPSDISNIRQLSKYCFYQGAMWRTMVKSSEAVNCTRDIPKGKK